MAELRVDSMGFPPDKSSLSAARFQFHCLYILENGRDAYIGETKDIWQRCNDHRKPGDQCSQYKFKRIHILTGINFDETPAKHLETLLIRLMRADGKFRVHNTKTEWQHYYRKNEFELRFDQVWLELERLGLVKHKEFQDVLNLSQYKFSPGMPLTQAQHEALTSIVHTMDSGETLPHADGFLPRPILISGDPGTGKTVVATSLFYYLRTHEPYKNMKIALVYAETSTRAEIQEVFKSVPGLWKKDVVSPIKVTKENYDIVICDEAQRLRRPKNAGRFYTCKIRSVNSRLNLEDESTELDWLLSRSKYLILFYDSKQSVAPSDTPKENFDKQFYEEHRGVRPIALQEQMRIRAGEKYVPYVYSILYQTTRRVRRFGNYDFRLFLSFDDMFKRMRELENSVGLCRLCVGYAWKWVARDDPSRPDIQLGNTDIWWNRQTGGWLHNPEAKDEMGSIYTLAGLDLNYAAVVIGPELFYDPADKRIKVDRSKLYDKKVKMWKATKSCCITS